MHRCLGGVVLALIEALHGVTADHTHDDADQRDYHDHFDQGEAARAGQLRTRRRLCEENLFHGNLVLWDRLEILLDRTADAHDRQKDRHHDEANHAGHDQGHRRHKAGEQAINRILCLDVERIGDLEQHVIERARLLAD